MTDKKIIQIRIMEPIKKSHYDRIFIQATVTIGLILMYYCFSIGITFFQKSFIKQFHYPFLVVTCHSFVKLILAAIVRQFYICATRTERISLSCSTNLKKLSIVGLVSSLDIGLSNWSFEFITVSLYTMTKSTCIIFILLFAILFGLEKKRISLIGIISLIAIGLLMFTYQSTQFNLTGFLLALSASFCGGLRWTMAQVLMQRKELGLSSPIDMIYHIQPWMVIGLLPLTLWFEGIPAIQNSSFTMEALSSIPFSLILIGAALAFLMELSEYLLLTFTSCLTLSIAGIFKEIFTLYLAVEYSGDQMSIINFCGLMLCMTGISMHVYHKTKDLTTGGKAKKMDQTYLLNLNQRNY